MGKIPSKVSDYIQHELPSQLCGFEFLWCWWFFVAIFHSLSFVLKIIIWWAQVSSPITLHHRHPNLPFLYDPLVPKNCYFSSLHLISQFSWYSSSINILESKKVDNVAHSFVWDSQFKSSVFFYRIISSALCWWDCTVFALTTWTLLYDTNLLPPLLA
jgi:hypothetical protein